VIEYTGYEQTIENFGKVEEKKDVLIKENLLKPCLMEKYLAGKK
jgi:hypothetical protein